MATLENAGDDTGVRMFPKETDDSDVIKELANLFLNDLVIEIDALREVVKQFGDAMSQWLLNMDSFDYDRFDCNWIMLCQPGLLRSLARNDVVKNGILAAYRKQYKEGKILHKVESRIMKYFILNMDEVENEE